MIQGKRDLNRYALHAAIHISAIFAIHLAFVMLIPAAVDLYYGNEEWKSFFISALVTGSLATGIMIATQGESLQTTTRFGFLLVNLLWLTMAIGGSIPFMLSPLGLSFTDAFFESMSGVTTTGSTVLNSLDQMNHGLLVWRSLLSFLGGLGVVVLSVFLLPVLNIGGISWLKIESSDIVDRPFERLQTFTISLFAIYAGLMILCAFCYIASGMETFDAINHAMSTVATGGFSTHNTSFMRYAEQPMILWTGSFFMFLGGLPFSILILFSIRRRTYALKDPQIRTYATLCLLFTLLIAIYLRATRDIPFGNALAHSAFNFISLITTAGFASDDYTLWGPFVVVCAYVATFLGGCSGSTTGGIKTYRLIIVFQCIINGVRQMIYPNIVQPVRYGDRPVSVQMQQTVILFIAFFFIMCLIFTMLLGATGLDFTTSLTAALTSFTNVGPGLGSIIGPSGNFSSLPDSAKWICSIAMLLGRLEIFAVLVIFSSVFWRQ